MSELHTYWVEWSEEFGMPHEVSNVRAFTAADAVAQKSLGGCRVHRVEPLPDAPTLQQAQADARRYEWVTIPIGGKCPKPPAPAERIEALEAALRERTRQWDRSRTILMQVAEALVGKYRDHPDYRDENLPRAVRGVCEGRDAARAERDHLRAERDALAVAALGADDGKPSIRKFEGDVGVVLNEIRHTRARAENRRDALNEIAAIVWPNTDLPNSCYVLADLVEAVRKMGASGEQAQRPVKTVAYANAQLDQLAAELRKVRAERDAAQRRLSEIVERSPDVYRVTEISSARRERDALQKRIDAAKAWISDRFWNAARGPSFDGLLVILEGREP